MNFKSLSDLLSGGGSPIEQVDITGNMNVEEKLNEIVKSMSFGPKSMVHDRLYPHWCLKRERWIWSSNSLPIFW